MHPMNERFPKADREWVDEHLEAYLDGELSSPDTSRMERTLEASPELARELTLARRIHEDLAQTPDYLCPPVVSRQVFARTRRTESRDRRWWESFIPPAPAWGLAGLAATILLAAGLWFVVPQFAGEQGEEFIVIDGQRFTVEEIAQAQADMELAMAYVDHMSNQINKQVSSYVSGESMLKSVNTGLNKGASNARKALGKMYRDESS
jgi:hypothetical protein